MGMRRLLAVLLLVAFAFTAVSGYMVHLRLGGFHLRIGHELMGYLLVVLGGGHMVLNRRAMMAHLGLNGRRRQG